MLLNDEYVINYYLNRYVVFFFIGYICLISREL